MKEPVNLICATNSVYMMPLAVMLVSVVVNFDPDRDLIIHVISNDAAEADREKIRQSLELNRPGLDHVAIHWHTVDPNRMAGLVTRNYITMDAYFRFFAPEMLPLACERAIYLDCDLVVLTDLSKLYDSTAAGKTLLHAAHDVSNPFVSSYFGVYDYEEQGLDPHTHAMNSGVLVIDLKQWRERKITEQLLAYLIKAGKRLRLHDQGAFNGVLHHDWTPLDLRWNQGTFILFPEWFEAAGYSREDWLQAKNDPYIVHYAGGKKPWQKRRKAPRYSHFFTYLRRTLYKDAVPHAPFLENLLGRRLYYQLWKFERKLIGLLRRPPSSTPTL